MWRTVVVLLLLSGCHRAPGPYEKFEVKEAIAHYRLQHPLSTAPVEQKVYISNYGATEYFEFVNKREPPFFPTLKMDRMEHVFVTDSTTVSVTRGYDFLYENLVLNPNSKLYNWDLVVQSEADTNIQGYSCNLISFLIEPLKYPGKAALWKGIPLWGKVRWESGQVETLELIELDLDSAIPQEKTRLMEWVNTGRDSMSVAP
ncbi:MAG: hypothetical protein ACFB10_23840 [Salibacteraceae bacterium]